MLNTMKMEVKMLILRVCSSSLKLYYKFGLVWIKIFTDGLNLLNM